MFGEPNGNDWPDGELLVRRPLRGGMRTTVGLYLRTARDSAYWVWARTLSGAQKEGSEFPVEISHEPSETVEATLVCLASR